MKRSTLDSLKLIATSLGREIGVSDDVTMLEEEELENNGDVRLREQQGVDTASLNQGTISTPESREQACKEAAAKLREVSSMLKVALALKHRRNPPLTNIGGIHDVVPTTCGSTAGETPLALKRQVQQIRTALVAPLSSSSPTDVISSSPTSGRGIVQPRCAPVSVPQAINNAIKEGKLSHRKAEFLQKLQPQVSEHQHHQPVDALVALQQRQREKRAWCYLMGNGCAEGNADGHDHQKGVQITYGNLQLDAMSTMAKEHIELSTRIRLAKDIRTVEERIQETLEARRLKPVPLGQKRRREEQETEDVGAMAKMLRMRMMKVVRCENGLIVIQLRSLCLLYLTFNSTTRKWSLLHLEWTILGAASHRQEDGSIEARIAARLVPDQHKLVFQSVAKKLTERGLYDAIKTALLAACGVVFEFIYGSLRGQQPDPAVPQMAQSMLDGQQEMCFIALKHASDDNPEPLYTQVRLDFQLGGISIERRRGANVRTMLDEDWVEEYLAKTRGEVMDCYHISAPQQLEVKEVSASYAVVDLRALLGLATSNTILLPLTSPTD